MSIETVKRLAELAGDDISHTLQSDLDFLERFAALVAHEAGEVMRNNCVEWVRKNIRHRDGRAYIAIEIRALPGVTLEDIK